MTDHERKMERIYAKNHRRELERMAKYRQKCIDHHNYMARNTGKAGMAPLAEGVLPDVIPPYIITPPLNYYRCSKCGCLVQLPADIGSPICTNCDIVMALLN